MTLAQFWNVPGKDIPVEAAFGFRNASDYEKASIPGTATGWRPTIAWLRPDRWPSTDPHERAWLTDGRDL